jgi:PAS domain S-box-containing protein
MALDRSCTDALDAVTTPLAVIAPDGDDVVFEYLNAAARKIGWGGTSAAEARLNEAHRVTGLGSWEWDIAKDMVTWSDELFRIFGVTREEHTPTFPRYLEMVHPEDRDRIAAAVQTAFDTGGDYAFDERIVRPDGTIRHLHSGGKTIQDDDGTTIKMIGVCHDVTESREAQTALEKRRFADEQAAQINDGIIDALVRAMRALEDGDHQGAQRAMNETLEHASRIVTELGALPQPS